MAVSVALDVLVFGGGSAGLWMLDVLAARGARVLLVENHALGAGQTVASQGIIHGGLKYTLQGLLTRSATSIREMPRVWRECLAGEQVPNLAGVKLRSEFCYLWRTETLSSRIGMLGASFGLHVAPDVLPAEERPDVFDGCPGTVATLAEPVISPASFVEVLRKRNLNRLLKVDAEGVEFSVANSGTVAEVRLASGPHALSLRPRLVVLAAGAGNADLLRRLGRNKPQMQRRPLHMVMARGDLPVLNGHCVDGAKTRVTITSERLTDGQVVWQIGGQIAEDGVSMEPAELIRHAQAETQAVLPSLRLQNTAWATYRVDRAEGSTAGNKRPDDIQISREGNVLTCWPTKLALAPELARAVACQVEPSDESILFPGDAVREWTKPQVAASPWETATWWRNAVPAAA